MQKIRSGDEVIVVCGSNKGARGQVEKIVFGPDRMATHVLVTGVNMRVKHTKPNPSKGDPGGKVSREAPLHISNVALYNEEKGGADKVRIKVGENGERTREFASGGLVP